MAPLTIMLIRHGEKPQAAMPELGVGLTAVGHSDPNSLTVRGWQRAGAWAALFGSGLSALDYKLPDIVYAANPNQAGDSGDDAVSQRPWETVLPLCARLGAAPVTTHGVGDETALVNDVSDRSGVVLICWEHKKIITTILPQLTNSSIALPPKWHGDRFDLVLRLDRSADGAWQLTQLFPRLLGGDTDIPL